MEKSELQKIIDEQGKFFQSGATLDIGFRLEALEKFRKLLRDLDPEIMEALRLDLGKHPFESYASEHGLVLQEIRIMIRNRKTDAMGKWLPTRCVPPT